MTIRIYIYICELKGYGQQKEEDRMKFINVKLKKKCCSSQWETKWGRIS